MSWNLGRHDGAGAVFRRKGQRAAVAILLLASSLDSTATVNEAGAGEASDAGVSLRGSTGHPGRQLDTSPVPGADPDPDPDSDGDITNATAFGTDDDVLSPAAVPEQPDAMQWVLAVILVALLFGHLVRIWRVLRGENTLVLQHSAPDGMRTVQCGQCAKMQYLQVHIRNFICYNCTATNRLTVDLLRSASGAPVPELIENTGSLKRYEFRKQGNLYWQLLKESEEVEDGQVTDLAAGPEKRGEADPERGNQLVEAGLAREPFQAQAQVTDATAAEAESGPDALADAASRASRTSREAAAGEWESCGVCWDNPGYMVLLPCSHGSVCEYCATRIAQNRATGGSHCPHCRADINMLVKLTELRADNDEVWASGVEHRVPIARVLGASAHV